MQQFTIYDVYQFFSQITINKKQRLEWIRKREKSTTNNMHTVPEQLVKQAKKTMYNYKDVCTVHDVHQHNNGYRIAVYTTGQ